MPKWIRQYADDLDDQLLQGLEPDLFMAFMNLRCAVAKSETRGRVPDATRVAFLLRTTESRAGELLEKLRAAGAIKPNGYLHKWVEQQRGSDSSTARMRDYRARKDKELQKCDGNAPSQVRHENRHGDAGSPEVSPLASPLPRPLLITPSPTASRLSSPKAKTALTSAPETIQITTEMRQFAAKHAPGFDVEQETEHFLDSARANNRRYANWPAAWRTWMRNAPKFENPSRGGARQEPSLHEQLFGKRGR